MRGMTLALPHYSTSTWVLLIIALLVLLSVTAAFLGRKLISRGLREPIIVRMINRTSERVVSAIKRPITIAVLDEVADVLRSGHYTRNVVSALDENHDETQGDDHREGARRSGGSAVDRAVAVSRAAARGDHRGEPCG